MDGYKELTDRQLRTISHLLAAPSIEEGCKRARVSKAAIYEWLKSESFKAELKRQRDELTQIALDALKANVAKATQTLVRLLESASEQIQCRAAEDILEFAQKAIEHEQLERRIEALEENLRQQQQRGNR